MRQPVLRPGDVAVALELVLRPDEGYVPLARAVGISLGEAHNAVRRLGASGLLLPGLRRPNRSAILEFLSSGVRYAFPGVLGPEAPGVPTAHAGPSLARTFRGARPLVWPSMGGAVRGDSLTPLYPGAPGTAARVPDLYELLTLVDALRVGRARERSRAAALVRTRLGLAEQ